MAVAATLDGLASMFERAVFSSGRIFASIQQLIVIVVVAAFVGVTLFLMFLPLIQLLNDLT